MYCLVAIKFRNPRLRKLLVDTHEAPLQESVKSQEGYWSMYTYSGQPDQNMQGQILMQVRQFNRMHQNPPKVKRWPDVTRVDHMIEQITMQCSTRHPADNRDITRATNGPDKNIHQHQ